jgi:uncharacterized membrane protein
MHRRLPVLIRSTMYALRGGFLVRPFMITILLGVAGAILSATEETVPTMGAWIPEILFPSRQDPQVARAILSAIATSIMTVVSIVFAILLMTLTLASTQLIQIVDIALRAISPAVNDPSTAISCVDQLRRILIRWLGRVPPATYLYGPPHVLRVVLPQIRPEGLLDTAFEQIRHYSQSDVAVSLRLLRAFNDIVQTVIDPDSRATLLQRASRVVSGCAPHLPEDDPAKLHQRLTTIEANVVAR